MAEPVRLHPFLQLMKRYCIDYTNSHDTSWIPKIMREDYVVHISEHHLLRSESYLSSVEALFADAPGLGLTVHEIYCNGDRLAMRFSEHARWRQRGGAFSTWRGFSTYSWDGERLTSCWVEQDFLSRERQIARGIANAPGAPAIDPWMTDIVPESAAALAAGRAWLETFDLSKVKQIEIDDNAEDASWALEVLPDRVEINDIFSAGPHVPFHLTLIGQLRQKLETKARLAVCGVITVDESGAITRLQAVSDRLSIRRMQNA